VEDLACAGTVTSAPEEESAVPIPDFSLCLKTRDEPTKLAVGDHLRIHPKTKEVHFVRDDDKTLLVIRTETGGVYQTLSLKDAPLTEENAETFAARIARRFSLEAIPLRRRSEHHWVTFLIVPPKGAES
jgi:hypothetical protein